MGLEVENLNNIGREKIKNQITTIKAVNLIFSKLVLSRLNNVCYGRIKKYKTKRRTGTVPRYPRPNPKPEVFPRSESLDDCFNKEL